MVSLLRDPGDRWTLAAARAYCTHFTKTQYENFTIGSLLLPRDKRPHLFALYSFCRWTDDLGDETLGDRLELLSLWEDELKNCYGGMPTHPVMVALQLTIDEFDIPIDPFIKLIEANRMDQRNTRYATYEDLLYYCDYSANPVGDLVLYILGHRDKNRRSLSDSTCTALQLANFWQDVARDMEKGRIYIPLEDMASFGYREEELRMHVASSPFKQLMKFEIGRTKKLFRDGIALLDSINGIFKLDLALFTRGGMKILQEIERNGYDVLSRRPVVTRAQKTRLMFSTLIRMKLGMSITPD